MKEYDVKITETLEKTVTVEAESRDAAEEQVKSAYYNSEYILDAENFTGVEFGIQAEREIQQEQAPQMEVLLIKPGMYPQAVQIGCELEDLQKAVGGDIEAVYPYEEPVALVTNRFYNEQHRKCQYFQHHFHKQNSFLLTILYKGACKDATMSPPM